MFTRSLEGLHPTKTDGCGLVAFYLSPGKKIPQPILKPVPLIDSPQIKNFLLIPDLKYQPSLKLVSFYSFGRRGILEVIRPTSSEGN